MYFIENLILNHFMKEFLNFNEYFRSYPKNSNKKQENFQNKISNF